MPGSQLARNRLNAFSAVEKSAFPWWLIAIVILGAALMSAGGLIALLQPSRLLSPQAEVTTAVHIYAGYFAARALALAALLLWTLGLRARASLNILMLLTAFTQVADICVDCLEKRWAVLPGIVVIAILFLVGSARLCGYPFWRIEAWKQGVAGPGTQPETP